MLELFRTRSVRLVGRAVPLSCHTRNGVHGVRRPTNESEHTGDVRVPRIAAAALLCEACASQQDDSYRNKEGSAVSQGALMLGG